MSYQQKRNYFFLCALFLSFICHPLIQADEPRCLSWDNVNYATQEELLADPLLRMRTKGFFPSELNQNDLDVRVDDLKEKPPAVHVHVTHVFHYEAPHFELTTKNAPELIWWQISPFKDFHVVSPSLERVEQYKETLSLPRYALTFFNNGAEYFFRIRTKSSGVWSDWSKAQHFHVVTPDSPKNIKVIKGPHSNVKIQWEGAKDPSVNYWLFGSNSFDFMPEIYFDTSGEYTIKERKPENNFVVATANQQLPVLNRLAFFRLVAEKNGCFSIPSRLIKLSEVELEKASEYQVKVDYHNNLVEQNKNPSYLMPDDHPIKAKLDAIFSSARVLESLETLRKAGFKTGQPRVFTRVIVARHPSFPGYLFKLFLDAQRYDKVLPLYKYWGERIQGARLIQQEINNRGWQHLFKVPQKWIYALPPKPAAKSDFYAKNYLLVVEDMQIFPASENNKMWKSDALPYEILHHLFILVKELGLSDSMKPDNNPFSKDGRIAFVDTQAFHRSPRFRNMLPYLSSKNKKVWGEFIKNPPQ